ncbi:recombination mediator RecR [Campylobacter sp. JMF_01 NE2]|uniref:recombination mediator RecR n=1 Tax=unclassified Campylobacter TaxID=2593542 RepID=UPI001B799CE0|nr:MULTISPECIES: recombination mediator RecR [unclassified Campylobacter]MBP3224781.1 recombination protein RecR [Campylobacter sp.]MDA3042440.1 recombination mediator RecR [Campylobacter sp. JMF_09 ED2]MDA3044746.1 recombination mediator RecR [Campylobacter sp. JMF_07 ED4]MDA3047779.1 recombination mediator RecR [Campylobacter sp. JMF_08 NE1]MDA3049471.1 recombination mediator RecR [Campylobacter sp. JMF_15 NE4]
MSANDKFEELVASFEKLPGVGKKSALRFAYYVSVQNSTLGLNLAHNIEEAVRGLKKCEICGAICEDEICEYCADEERESEKIAIVESPKDIFIFESNKIFNGKYFVLEDASEEIIDKLRAMIIQNGANELIFALTPSINSDGIMLYVEDKLSDLNLRFSKLAQGVPTGVSLDNIDMLSLMKAINGRTNI